jgi:hypothetical protein
MKDCIFKEILSPLLPIIENEANALKPKDDKYSLSFQPFIINLLFCIIEGIKSISQLVTSSKTSPKAKELQLVKASKSMYNEAFRRYSPASFRKLFAHLLTTLEFIEIPELKSLGRFFLVDGSIFPAIKTMSWATYKKATNGIKLHLCFDLNRMIPVNFISGEANYSEKDALLCMLQKGVTFIADRGYFAFKLFMQIVTQQAHFIIRAKTKIRFTLVKALPLSVPDDLKVMLSNVTDMLVIFDNDPNKAQYRIVSFTVMGELYNLVTDRLDLTTSEIIILYAYRWQVELIFRFLKRTLNGLHLMNQRPEGIEIQFILYMIAYLLMLNFKQRCNLITETSTCSDNNKSEIAPPSNDEESEIAIKENPKTPKSKRIHRYDLVTMLGKRLKKYWKIGIHWLINLRNLLLEEFTLENMIILRC